MKKITLILLLFIASNCVYAQYISDLQVTPQGQLLAGYIPMQQTLTYKISFQNIDTPIVVNLEIIDSLSSYLDTSTIVFLNASHTYTTTYLAGNVIRFSFPNIMLTDSISNGPNSKGFIEFSIKPKNSNLPGNQITNTAHIYFDFNPAITTNTVVNTLFSNLRIDSTTAKRNTSCNLPCGNGAVNVIANGGVLPFTHSITPMCAATAINNNTINNLKAGTYTVQTTDAIGASTNKTVTILNPIPIVLNLTSIQPVGQAGSASVTPTGGSPPYDYLWLPGNATTSSITNLGAGNYTVNIIDANGCSNSSNIQLDYATAITTIPADQFIQLWPNPASNNIIVATNTDLGKISIFNSTVQFVYTINTNNQHTVTINIQELAAGIYYLQLGNGAIKKFRKE